MAAKMAVYCKKGKKISLKTGKFKKCVLKLYFLMILELQTSSLLCFSDDSIVPFSN